GPVAQVPAELGQHLRHIVGDVPQVAALHVHRQVDGRLQVHMVNFRGDLGVRDGGQVLERDGDPLLGTGDRNVQDVVNVVEILVRVLDTDEVLAGADGIDPEVLFVVSDAGIGGGDDAGHDVVLVEPLVRRLGPIDVDDELRGVRLFQNARIHNAGDLLDRSFYLAGKPPQHFLVFALKLNVDRGRFALVQGAA